MNRSVTVFGTGNWALTLADLAQRSGSQVMIYARRPDVAHVMSATRQHPEFLPHLRFGPSVRMTAEPEEAAMFSENWLMVVPSQFLRELAEKVKPWVRSSHSVVTGSKGLEKETHLRMSQVLRDTFGTVSQYPAVGALSGPNLAFEVSHQQPCASVLAMNRQSFELWTAIIGGANLRLYQQDDLAGVELGGALKNILAIAVGIAHAVGLGESAKSAIMTRGLHEMGRLAVRLGANWMTLAGLSGLGDLVATASSPHSRNRWCGEQLGQGRPLQEILRSTTMVVEGVSTAYVAYDLGQQFGLPLPITEEVLAIFQGKSVNQAISDLMARATVSETQL